MRLLIKIENKLNQFSDGVGSFSAVLLLLLVANVFYDVVMRYGFNNVSIGMQEMEWHLYATMFLFGIAYGLKADGHVRVDLIYERLNPVKKAVIDITGTLIFLLPFCLLITVYGFDFAQESYQLNEKSGDPGGLPWRWVIKAMIPAAFICVMISSLGFMLRALNEALGLHEVHHHDSFQL